MESGFLLELPQMLREQGQKSKSTLSFAVPIAVNAL